MSPKRRKAGRKARTSAVKKFSSVDEVVAHFFPRRRGRQEPLGGAERGTRVARRAFAGMASSVERTR